jgi:NAD(P)-dependent dehydrogenase (short-subunit alcohol dehydrogenase family)
MPNIVVVIGAGQIGQAIARRVSVGRHVVLADRSEANANAAAEVMNNAGYRVSVATVDVSSRAAMHALVGKATEIGDVVGLIYAAGVSPSQASPEDDASCGSLGQLPAHDRRVRRQAGRHAG